MKDTKETFSINSELGVVYEKSFALTQSEASKLIEKCRKDFSAAPDYILLAAVAASCLEDTGKSKQQMAPLVAMVQLVNGADSEAVKFVQDSIAKKANCQIFAIACYAIEHCEVPAQYKLLKLGQLLAALETSVNQPAQ